MGDRKCGVDFDYGGWMRWGALRREKRVCELPGSGSGSGGEGGLGWMVRRDCWVDCGFPGECGGFRRWLRREEGRFEGVGVDDGGGMEEGGGIGEQEEEELYLRREMVQRFFDGDESSSSSSSSNESEGSGFEDAGLEEGDEDVREVEEIRRQFGEGLGVEVDEGRVVDDRARDGEGDITMRDLDVDVGAGINGATEYSSNFQIDIPKMIDGILKTGFGESPPSSPLKEEVCCEWTRGSERSESERSELEKRELEQAELERKESERSNCEKWENRSSSIWNDEFGDLGIREMSEKIDPENSILAECLRGSSLLVRRCEVGEEMFGDEEGIF